MHQKYSYGWTVALVSLLLCEPTYAHDIIGSGWFHPLTGLDHMLAMIAVGVWSAQIGGRAIYTVPLAFLAAMAIGAGVGFAQYHLSGMELGIALSVLLLGVAIAVGRTTTLWVATVGVGIFGICHGYAHGFEMPGNENPWGYAAGFLLTTAGLHVVGAAGGMLLLDSQHGKRWLHLAGVATAVAGGYLTLTGSI